MFEHPLLRYSVKISNEAKPLLDGLKKIVKENVIDTPEVQTLEYRGQQVVMELFEAMASDPKRLLPEDTKNKLMNGSEHDRIICDPISGMTDEYATRMYERLFLPRSSSLFEKM